MNGSSPLLMNAYREHHGHPAILASSNKLGFHLVTPYWLYIEIVYMGKYIVCSI